MNHDYEIFYLYDVYSHDLEVMIVNPEDIRDWATTFGIPSVPVFQTLINPTIEDIDTFVGETYLAVTRGEGVVLKNPDFINRFGRHAYAKRVCEKFSEVKPKIKVSRDDVAQAIVDKFITEARVNKIIAGIANGKETQGMIHGDEAVKPSMRWIGELLGRHWKDLWDEEIHAIIKFVRNDSFKISEVKKLHDIKVKKIFQDIMDKNAS